MRVEKMNDYTKDELQVILLDMIFYAKNKKIKNLNEAVSHVELREKIEAMIENYCDHCWLININNFFKFCDRCGIKYE